MDKVRIQERLRTMSAWYIDKWRVLACMMAEMRRETDVTWFDIPFSYMTCRAPGMSSRTASVLKRARKAGVVIMVIEVMKSNAWRYTDMRTPIPMRGNGK